MHELSLLQEAIEQALAAANRDGASRIHRITLRVGALSGVVPEALAFAFEGVTLGTAAEGARLDVEVVPAVCRCAGCACTFRPTECIFECPACGAIGQDVEQGRELQLATLEVS